MSIHGALQVFRMQVFRSACLFLLALVPYVQSAHAGVPDNTAPIPYSAVYSTSLNGFPLGIDLRLSMSPATGTENWNIALNAESRMMHYLETSEFHWANCQADPVKYRFEFKGYGVDRKLWLDFDHEKNVATGTNRKGPVTFTFPEGMTDELSLMFAARCQLWHGATEVTYNVATTNGMKVLTYRVEGHEKMKTPFGKIDTIKIVRVRDAGDKRRSIMWVAPSLAWTMVRLEHVEKFGVRGYATLKSLQGITPAP